jgi:hypothetical protein
MCFYYWFFYLFITIIIRDVRDQVFSVPVPVPIPIERGIIRINSKDIVKFSFFYWFRRRVPVFLVISFKFCFHSWDLYHISLKSMENLTRIFSPATNQTLSLGLGPGSISDFLNVSLRNLGMLVWRLAGHALLQL